jgi:hypothetical protein
MPGPGKNTAAPRPPQFEKEKRVMPGKPAADRSVNLYIDGYNFYVPLSRSGKESDYELTWCNFLKLGEHLVDRLVREDARFAGCRLGAVKYFTATIPFDMPRDPSGIQRKHNWLDALHQVTGGRVEVIHGTFRSRTHRFYIESSELETLARAGIPINWDLIRDRPATYRPQLTIHEEKQTDVMLAAALLTDAALGRQGRPAHDLIQASPRHRTNKRPTPAPCHAAVVVSADIDFLPAAEMAANVFDCPVAIAFTYPHRSYNLSELAETREGIAVREVSEQELRACLLPELVALDGGRKVSLHDFKKTHFQKSAFRRD